LNTMTNANPASSVSWWPLLTANARAAVADGFVQMGLGYLFFFGQVGDGAGHSQDAVAGP